MTVSWFDRFLTSVADRGRALVRLPAEGGPALERALELVCSLASERGEASGAALAQALMEAYRALGAEDRLAFYAFLVEGFAPDPVALKAAAEAYCGDPGPTTAMELATAAEPPRRELLRRMNLAPKAMATLVGLRADVLNRLAARPELGPLDSDLKYLFTYWFNRGFLDLRRINWHTPAAILEKLIAYEAVHEITGWEDLRRRLAPDRRCFAFFHPALDDEPLIFVEVALVSGISDAIAPLLDRENMPEKPTAPDTAIFYSISNCQFGLRGISFGNFLIKQVVEELKAEMPSLQRFSTLSPIPGFRSWLRRRIAADAEGIFRPEDVAQFQETRKDAQKKEGPKKEGDGEPALAETAAEMLKLLEEPGPDGWAGLKAPLMRLCATFLTTPGQGNRPDDPVARFHLGNGARLERINWLADTSSRALRESYGMMVNYLYDPDSIEANHEAFIRQGQVVRSKPVSELLRDGKAGLLGAGLLSLARH